MKSPRYLVLVSNDPASLDAGASSVFKRFQEELRIFGLSEDVMLATLQDISPRQDLPLVVVYPDAAVFGPVTPQDVNSLVEKYLLGGRVDKRLLPMHRELSGDLAWLKARKGTLPVPQRVVLERAGSIDPGSLDDYLLYEGYEALGMALTSMIPEKVIEEIDQSGLRGRGGAGFPAGRKWSFVSKASGKPKYVVCNADESEPGTFKDRLVLEGDPFSILEAMTIAGYAVGAHEGFIYVRGEYRRAQQLLENAIQQAMSAGLLGHSILGTKFDFHIHLHSGAGAYICGEETALIESLEGKRGQPRARPPYPPTSGLWGKPTLVNNVETLANVPVIIRRGAAWYRQMGTAHSTGTKVFTILGNVNAPGSVEVTLGITLRELIEIYGKGMREGARIKLVQSGGSSGSIVPARLIDAPMTFDSFRDSGVSLGSGALLVCDESTCVVDLAKVLMHFFRYESCSKCTPCRTGTQRAYMILDRISHGKGSYADLEELQLIGEIMEQLSNCGLGQSASVPIRDVLKYFRDEVEAHIRSRSCPVGVCPVSERPAIAERVIQPAFG